MSKSVSLKATTRPGTGRTALKTLRRSGSVPGVLYGKKTKPTPIAFAAQEIVDLLNHSTSENILVDLDLSGEITGKRLALIQDVQHDPLKDTLIHVDLHEIAPDEELHTEVNVHSKGEPVGVKTGGGLLDIVMRKVKIACLPKDLPDEIIVDVSSLNIGQAIHISELPVPAGVRVVGDPKLAVFIVHAPTVEEAAPVAGAEVKQPEVIKEKKTDEAAAGDAKGGKGDAKGGKK